MPDPTSDLTLLQKFAPAVYLHPDETRLPCSADWFLTQCELTDQNGNVVAGTQNGITNSSTVADQAPGEKRFFHLRVLNHASYDGQQPVPGQGITSPCYGYVRPVTDSNDSTTNYDLNYWWFYAYNGNTFHKEVLIARLAAAEVCSLAGSLLFVGAGLLPAAVVAASLYATIETWDGVEMHEGDWVTAVVRLTQDQSAITEIYLEQHAGGKWYTPSQMPLWTNGRPCIYAAKHSHELYPQTGNYVTAGGFALDECAQGLIWDAAGCVVDVGWESNIGRSVEWTSASGPTLSEFTAGPSLAVNNNDFAVFGYFTQQRQLPAAGICGGRWEKESGGSPTFNPYQANAYAPMGGGLPTISLSDTGVFLLAYSSENILLAAGVIDTTKNVLTMVPNWPPNGVLPQETDGVPGIAISNSVNGVGYVWVEMHRWKGNYYWNVGSVGIGQNAQTINTPTNQAGTHFDHGDSIPSVAMNDSGVVVSVHSSGTKLFYSIGTVDPSRWKLSIGAGKYYGKGQYPQVALSNTGQVVELHIGTSGDAEYYTGTVQTGSNGSLFVQWDATPGEAPMATWTDTQPASVSLLDGGTLYAASGPNSCWQGVIIDNFVNWQPPYPWLKYSGAWGKPGSGTVIDMFGLKIARISPGPPGPAVRSSFLSGPKGG